MCESVRQKLGHTKVGVYMLESTQLQLGIYVVIFLVQNNYESSCRNLLVDLQTENWINDYVMIWQLRIVEGTKKRDNSMYNIIRADNVLEFLAMWISFDTKFTLHSGITIILCE